MGEQTYTYRGGERIVLEKSSDKIVVRALPQSLEQFSEALMQRVSSASTRISVSEGQLEAVMAATRENTVTHHAYFQPESDAEFLITDRVLVTFKTGTSLEEIEAFEDKYRLVTRQTYDDVNRLFELTNATGMNPVKLVVNVTENEGEIIEVIEHDLNYLMEKQQFTLPTEALYRRSWHLHRHSQHRDFDPRSSSRCEEAWQALGNYGDGNVVIGVTDDGCKLDHGDFGSLNKFAGWGYMRGNRLVTDRDIDADPAKMYKVGANHGTSCSGVAAADVDGSLTIGAAPGCRLLPTMWESDGRYLLTSDSKLLTMINYMADKVDIMSNSWGKPTTNRFTLQVVNRIRVLSTSGGRRGNGIIFLWAAGNQNCPINETVSQNTPYHTEKEDLPDGSSRLIVYAVKKFTHNLAELPGVMIIAALSSLGTRSHYSNYGKGIDLTAPSNNVHSYRGTIRGIGIIAASGWDTSVHERFGGTSSATPLVAGIAALIISANPELTPAEVIAILKETASKDLDMTPYPRTPPVHYDPNPTWDVSPVAPHQSGAFQDISSPHGTWSPWFGHGKVDAFEAVTAAIRTRPKAAEGLSFKGASAPDRSIPDASERGIKDTIVCDTDFTIEDVSVTLDIQHSYIGDLVVTLLPPDGQQLRLWNRNGANQSNIQQEFTTATRPILLALAGQPSAGDWKLHIQDLASVDRGRLKSWNLTLNGRVQDWQAYENSQSLVIADNDPNGIVSTVSVTEPGKIKDIRLNLDVTHGFAFDLQIALFGPDGSSVILYDNPLTQEDSVITMFDRSNRPELSSFIGTSAVGNWTLKVIDKAPQDQGKLNRWSLDLLFE